MQIDPDICTNHPLEIGENEQLRSALLTISALTRRQRLRHPAWQAIGVAIRARAQRAARDWPRDADEFTSAFIVGAFAYLDKHVDTLIAAQSPWGLLLAAAQRDGELAVKRLRCAGLVVTDRSGHKDAPEKVPPLVSFDPALHVRRGEAL